MIASDPAFPPLSPCLVRELNGRTLWLTHGKCDPWCKRVENVRGEACLRDEVPRWKEWPKLPNRMVPNALVFPDPFPKFFPLYYKPEASQFSCHFTVQELQGWLGRSRWAKRSTLFTLPNFTFDAVVFTSERNCWLIDVEFERSDGLLSSELQLEYVYLLIYQVTTRKGCYMYHWAFSVSYKNTLNVTIVRRFSWFPSLGFLGVNTGLVSWSKSMTARVFIFIASLRPVVAFDDHLTEFCLNESIYRDIRRLYGLDTRI